MRQVINTKASLKNTVKEIINVVLANKEVAFTKPDFLKQPTTIETCKTLWYFVKNHINYTPDDFLKEQIRTPERTWADRKKGVDCEDYSIYIASCLLSLGINPTLRIVGNEKGFQHIYIVVKGTETIILDCCMDDFNKETTYSKMLDIPVKKGGESEVPNVGGYMLERLSGIENNFLFVGKIDEEVAIKIKRQSGLIILENGNDRYGQLHIEKQRGSSFLEMGYSVEEFVRYVCENFNEIRKGKSGSLLLVKRNGNPMVGTILLKPFNGGEFYSVGSAFFSRKEYLEDKELLWVHVEDESSPSLEGLSFSSVPLKKGLAGVSVQDKKFFNATKLHRNSKIQILGNIEKSTADILAYEGKGSKGKEFGKDSGILYQFFTPDWLISLMWKLCIHHGFKGGNALEPSCGTGRFMYYAPKDLKIEFTGFELEEMLADYAKVVCPEAKIYHGGFETAFLKSVNGFWHKLGNGKHGEDTWLPPMDLVIGNPPYGQLYDRYNIGAGIKRFGQVEQYFMMQGLKVLKSGGLMCYVTASGFASTYEQYMKTKSEMNNLCTLVDAYRLPNVFKNTNVPTDILIFRKK